MKEEESSRIDPNTIEQEKHPAVIKNLVGKGAVIQQVKDSIYGREIGVMNSIQLSDYVDALGKVEVGVDIEVITTTRITFKTRPIIWGFFTPEYIITDGNVVADQSKTYQDRKNLRYPESSYAAWISSMHTAEGRKYNTYYLQTSYKIPEIREVIDKSGSAHLHAHYNRSFRMGVGTN